MSGPRESQCATREDPKKKMKSGIKSRRVRGRRKRGRGEGRQGQTQKFPMRRKRRNYPLSRGKGLEYASG